MECTETPKVPNVEKLYNFHDFFWVPNTIFKSFGYDFMGTTTSKRMRNFLLILFGIIIIGHIYLNCFLCRQLYLANFEEHVMDIVRLASCVSYSMNSNVKFLGFLIHRKLAHHIFDTLLEAYPKDKQLKMKYNLNSFYMSKFERLATILYLIACWNVVFCPLILSFSMYRDSNIFPYLKCYPCEYLYNYHTPLRYLGVYLIEMAHSHYIVAVNWGTDLWLVCFTSQICMHFSFIANEIENYTPEVANAEKDCSFLTELIKRHDVMLRLHKDLNKIFGISLAFNLISTTGVLCIVAIRLIVEGLGAECIAFGIFLINAIGQFYMVCYYGQKLSDAGSSIGVAAFKHSWFNSSVKYKKMLLILIMQSQKPTELLAVGLQALSLETFKTFLGAAYRIFAILQTLLDLNL